MKIFELITHKSPKLTIDDDDTVAPEMSELYAQSKRDDAPESIVDVIALRWEYIHVSRDLATWAERFNDDPCDAFEWSEQAFRNAAKRETIREIAWDLDKYERRRAGEIDDNNDEFFAKYPTHRHYVHAILMQKLMRTRMPGSSSMPSNMIEMCRYEAIAKACELYRPR